MGNVVRKEPCPKCREMGGDKSGDNLVIYEDESAYCFACSYTILSEEEKERRGLNNYVYEESNMSEPLTKEQIKEIRDTTGNKGQNSRGITDETFRKYGVRFEYDEESGDVSSHFYPVTTNYEISGFKIREIPKKFRSVGQTGKSCDAFGEWIFKVSNSKTVLIASGEVDCLSAYQMLENYRKGRNSDFEPTPVVSSTIGETGSDKQFQKRYNWLNRFDKIVICPDQDEAGKKAVEALVKVLPKNKVYVMELPMKDSNEMLMAGREKEWINAYFKARKYTPDGIVASSNLLDRMIEGAGTPRITLPPFMHKLQEMMAGGWPLKTIMTLSSASGTGKSSVIEAMMLHWIFNAPYKVGIISLESDAAQFSTKLLSAYIKHKIDLIPTQEERVEFLQQDWVKQKAKELFENEEGNSRFYLIEDRDGGIDSIKNLVGQMISSLDVQIIIIDPWSDLGEASSLEEQASMMQWLKGMVKAYDVSFGLVCHVRKSGTGQKANSTGADLHEEDIIGSGSVMKSSACNLLFTRNKEAEDDVERNTVYMKASKIRWTGNTGVAGVYYYDNETSTLWDKNEYFSSRGGTFQ